jgi:hypothetical protein
MDTTENAYKIVVENREGKCPLGRAGHGCKDNITIAVRRQQGDRTSELPIPYTAELLGNEAVVKVPRWSS